MTNLALAKIVESTGWSLAAVADHINRVGQENGINLSYNASAISHWLNGTRPRKKAIPLVVEALARAVRQADLTSAQLGWPEAAPSDPPRLRGKDPITCLSQLAREDLLNLGTVVDLYTVDKQFLLERPQSDQPFTAATRRAAAPCDIDHIRRMSKSFYEMATECGGVRGRTAICAYLLHDVVPHLRTVTGPMRPKLLVAVSEIVSLLGWMSVDAGFEGRGQAYYIQALRLADEAGSRSAQSNILTTMYWQAQRLGHRERDLLDAAVDAASTGCHPGALAAVATARAVALGAAGDRREAYCALQMAEREVERNDAGHELRWFDNFCRDLFAYWSGLALVHLGDLRGAEVHLADALAPDDVHGGCILSLMTACRANLEIAQGRFQDAHDTLRSLTVESTTITSSQLRHQLTTIRAALSFASSSPSERCKMIAPAPLII